LPILTRKHYILTRKASNALKEPSDGNYIQLEEELNKELEKEGKKSFRISQLKEELEKLQLKNEVNFSNFAKQQELTLKQEKIDNNNHQDEERSSKVYQDEERSSNLHQDEERSSKVYQDDEERSSKVNQEIVKFLAGCNLPLTLVDDQCFRKFVSFFDPKSEVKSSNEMSETECPLLYNNIKVILLITCLFAVCLSVCLSSYSFCPFSFLFFFLN
jgi:hypothetical protein